jgi:VIT1/CCC1 family predicted Fe2+/Mn2+ transporter
MTHPEKHRSNRVSWLRAAVLGANDGIVSTASLVIGVAAAGSAEDTIVLAGVAGLVAGAMSMAAGEFVSVSSQADTEKADLRIEKRALEEDYDDERRELAAIYRGRGLETALADEVSKQLMEHDALAAHARDEIGISEVAKAQPVQAALSSAFAFSLGAALPLLTVLLAPGGNTIPAVAGASLAALALLGAVAARAGGAPLGRGALRVVGWGAAAMVLTAAVGNLFGVTV